MSKTLDSHREHRRVKSKPHFESSKMITPLSGRMIQVSDVKNRNFQTLADPYDEHRTPYLEKSHEREFTSASTSQQMQYNNSYHHLMVNVDNVESKNK